MTRKSKVTGKTVTDYVDNAALTKAVNEYNARHYERMEKGLPKEKMPDVIGLAIMQIADAIGSRHNFRNYTYLDEMLGQARLQAVYSVTKFDGTKFDNAFGYFTLVIWRKMCQVIKDEREQQKIIEDLMRDPLYVCYEADENDNDHFIDINKENAVDFYGEGKLDD